jgi:hypothetical protein
MFKKPHLSLQLRRRKPRVEIDQDIDSCKLHSCTEKISESHTPCYFQEAHHQPPSEEEEEDRLKLKQEIGRRRKLFQGFCIVREQRRFMWIQATENDDDEHR